jgi:hypothetical protein
VNSDRDERDREKVDRGSGHRCIVTYRETFRERTVTQGAETERTKTDKRRQRELIQRCRDRDRYGENVDRWGRDKGTEANGE